MRGLELLVGLLATSEELNKWLWITFPPGKDDKQDSNFDILPTRPNVLLAINDLGKEQPKEDHFLKPTRCTRCSESLSPTMNFCSRCSLPVYTTKTLTREMELEKENKELREKYDRDMDNIRHEMDQKFAMILSMIKENPKLAQIKPNVLVTKQLG